VAWSTDLSTSWRVSLVAALAGLLFPVVRGALNDRCRLCWRSDGHLTLQFRPDDQGIPASLAPGSLRFGRWLVLRLRSGGYVRIVLLDAGAVDSATIRRFLREVRAGAVETV